MSQSLCSELIEAGVDAAQDADFADTPIGLDDGVENHRARDVLLHEFERISGIDFTRGLRLRQIRGWLRVAAGCDVFVTNLRQPALTRLELDAVTLRAADRGYAIVKMKNGGVLKDPAVVEPGSALEIRLRDGMLEAESK